MYDKFLRKHQVNFCEPNDVLMKKYAELYAEYTNCELARFECDVTFDSESYYIQTLSMLRSVMVGRGISDDLYSFPQLSDIF